MPSQQLYSYTLYSPNGQTTTGTARPKMTLAELQTAVGGFIEIVPRPYYAHQKWGRCTVYVNGDGKTSEEKRNPFFKDFGDGFNLVGNALKEEVYHG